MKQWNGTDASGRYQYPTDQISAWNMTIDERGTVHYIPHDGTSEPRIWCPASNLTRHLHRLEQIAARRQSQSEPEQSGQKGKPHVQTP